MKKLIIALLFMVGVAYSAIDTTGTTKFIYGNQLSSDSTLHYNVRSVTKGNGFWFYDSLWTGNYTLDSTSTMTTTDTTVILDTVYARTSVIIPLNFDYDWLQIAVYDSGTYLDDTLKIERGVIIYDSKTATASDTVWYGVNFKDSTFTDVSTLVPVDDNSTHLYTIWDAIMGLYKISITNVEVVANRVTYIWGSAKKRNK